MEAGSSRGCFDDDIESLSLCFLVVPFIIACSWVLIFPWLVIQPHPCGSWTWSELSLSILKERQIPFVL